MSEDEWREWEAALGRRLRQEEKAELKKRFGESHRAWMAVEVKILRLYYSTISTERLAKVLGRSHKAVRRKAEDLGLKKGPHWPY